MNPEPEITKLKSKIIRSRKAGRTTFEVVERATDFHSEKPVFEALNEFVERLEFTGLSGKWRQVNNVQARQIIVTVLHQDFAFRSRVMTTERAGNLADQFLALFENSRYFTNGVFDADGLSEYNPISQATFDSGVVCISETRIGILWVEDED